MNDAGTKRLALIKSLVREQGADGDKCWLIVQLETEAQALEAGGRIAELEAGIRAVEELIADSRGVVGLHLNGDEAPWDELLAGGRFEDWLKDFSAALVPQEAQAPEADARLAELEALFALQKTRMAEATRMWQEATGKQDVLPDLGDLLAWLMVRLVELEALEKALHCSWCGSLSWTALKWGRIVHKSACPHRLEPYHQGAPPDRYPEKPQEGKRDND